MTAFTACGGGGGGSTGTPTQPAAPTAPTVPWNQWALKGRVVETLSGAPIGGAKLTFYLNFGVTREIIASADGEWEISQASTEIVPFIEVSADGYLTRKTYIRWNVGTRDNLTVDLIKDSAPFSVSFYRELVRNTFDKPDELQPLWRLRNAPNFYVNTFNPRTGKDILPSELDIVTTTLRAAVPQVSGGLFEAGTIEIGSGERPEQPGVIIVQFVHEPESTFCGRARVGAEQGLITINYGATNCGGPCGGFAPRTLAHEVGHALGFFHVSEGSVLNTNWFLRDCGVTTFSAVERHHARIAYQRARFNRDVDWDPETGQLDEPMTTPVITCYR